ncbi:HU family DNA-binding protein [Treponema brennaborense]|uniref:HU domain-containing protein n=1 Tax=Treponema brennaborense (strain DSM 12168 / CIP 105900 / DD5/3) TaxID=906968 RepID=F4LIW0_TREBD|nr:HU family DNA-binding protein [Treponema brennaborense]AEE16285.1 hypothetical protein Trebr_0849 [Treponema brennaborense DSM 12168]
MAQYRVMERGEPGVAGGGKKKWYALAVNSREDTIDDITKSIEKISTVSGADIRAVLYALVDVSVQALERGEIVRLGDLGSMRLTLSSEGKEKEADVTAASIKKRGIIFSPGKKLKEMLETVKFTKA